MFFLIISLLLWQLTGFSSQLGNQENAWGSRRTFRLTSICLPDFSHTKCLPTEKTKRKFLKNFLFSSSEKKKDELGRRYSLPAEDHTKYVERRSSTLFKHREQQREAQSAAKRKDSSHFLEKEVLDDLDDVDEDIFGFGQEGAEEHREEFGFQENGTPLPEVR